MLDGQLGRGARRVAGDTDPWRLRILHRGAEPGRAVALCVHRPADHHDLSVAGDVHDATTEDSRKIHAVEGDLRGAAHREGRARQRFTRQQRAADQHLTRAGAGRLECRTLLEDHAVDGCARSTRADRHSSDLGESVALGAEDDAIRYHERGR